MKAIKYLLAICFVVISGLSSYAQNPSEEIIFKALNDEMVRSLSSLKLGKNNPPFFIANYVSQIKLYYAKATLGALVHSKETPNYNTNLRLMVGDYSLNDENFQSNIQSYSSGGAQLSFPKEIDYAAIRRAFWSMSDRSYKRAVDSYTQKKTALKQQNKDESEKVDDYLKTAPITLLMNDIPLKYDKKVWEKNIKELSAIFRKYPKIQTSSVDIYFTSTNNYVINSEGSKIKEPVAVACLLVNASAQAVDGESLKDQLTFYCPVADQLPSLERLKQDVNKFATELEYRCSAPVIEEPFQGPVVFEGNALVELLNNKLLGESGLISSREPVYATGITGGSVNKMENKIGKRICAENISIMSVSKTKSFGDTQLIGAFDVDAEGVVPSNGLVLVDKGILKTMLSNRIPTPKVKESNGHNRFGIWGNYMKSPGVIQVSYDNGQSYNDFLKTVANETTKSGLDYFYIIRRFETSNMITSVQYGSSGLSKPVAIYKVLAKTGEEKLVRLAVISEFPMLSFKYAIAGTTEQYVCNTMRWNSIPISYIAPKAIAFNDVSIEKDNAPKSKCPVVESPLAALSK
ncbi:MAG: metallopeptidase TldD-related protein [Bacteroidota bacterium]|nr:metallopeptidase TldD-related protein [Bacteroidota bacterium]